MWGERGVRGRGLIVENRERERERVTGTSLEKDPGTKSPSNSEPLVIGKERQNGKLRRKTQF